MNCYCSPTAMFSFVENAIVALLRRFPFGKMLLLPYSDDFRSGKRCCCPTAPFCNINFMHQSYLSFIVYKYTKKSNPFFRRTGFYLYFYFYLTINISIQGDFLFNLLISLRYFRLLLPYLNYRIAVGLAAASHLAHIFYRDRVVFTFFKRHVIL